MTVTNHTQTPKDDRVGEMLRVLADAERRAIIAHLQEEPTQTLSVEELTAQLGTAATTSEQDIRIRLHHVHLPKLEQAGIIDYDTATKTITYLDRPALESLLEVIESYDRPA